MGGEPGSVWQRGAMTQTHEQGDSDQLGPTCADVLREFLGFDRRLLATIISTLMIWLLLDHMVAAKYGTGPFQFLLQHAVKTARPGPQPGL